MLEVVIEEDQVADIRTLAYYPIADGTNIWVNITYDSESVVGIETSYETIDGNKMSIECHHPSDKITNIAFFSDYSTNVPNTTAPDNPQWSFKNGQNAMYAFLKENEIPPTWEEKPQISTLTFKHLGARMRTHVTSQIGAVTKIKSTLKNGAAPSFSIQETNQGFIVNRAAGEASIAMATTTDGPTTDYANFMPLAQPKAFYTLTFDEIWLEGQAEPITGLLTIENTSFKEGCSYTIQARLTKR
jgi:hypothetical protein